MENVTDVTTTTRERLLAIPLACAALALAPAAAGAAAPWSDPASLTQSGSAPLIDFKQDGPGLLAWTAGNDVVGATTGGQAPRGPARTLVEDMRASALGRYASHWALIAGTASPWTTSAVPKVARVNLRAGTTRVHDLVGRRHVSYLDDLAVNDRGDAIIALRICPHRVCKGKLRTGKLRPYVVTRRHGRGYSKPRPVDRRPAASMDVAIDAAGRTLVAWSRPRSGGRRSVHERRGSVRRGLGKARAIGRAWGSVTLSTTLAGNGRMVVAWLSQQIWEGTLASPIEVFAAAARRGRPFGRATRLERFGTPDTTGTYVAETGVRVASTLHGDPLVAWTGFGGGHYVVRSADVRRGRLTTPRTLSAIDRDTILGGADVNSDGAAAVLGLEGRGGQDPTGPRALVAFSRTAGADEFGAAELISGGGNAGFYETALAIEPRTSRPVAVWRDLQPARITSSNREPLSGGR